MSGAQQATTYEFTITATVRRTFTPDNVVAWGATTPAGAAFQEARWLSGEDDQGNYLEMCDDVEWEPVTYVEVSGD